MKPVTARIMKLMNINACWIRSFSVIRMCCAAPACSRSDLPSAFRESMLRLFNKIEEVVREHASDSHDNQDDIDEADPVKDAGAGVAAHYDVDGPWPKFFPAPGWQRPQVAARFALLTVEAGSEDGLILWTP